MSTLFTRRDALKMGGAVALFVATPTWAGRKNSLTDYRYRGPLGAPTMFSHGLASGDPLPDGIVLWTRVSPDHDGAVDVYWEIARDEAFADRVASGTVTTTPR
jgi:alkaline phosphatase D